MKRRVSGPVILIVITTCLTAFGQNSWPVPGCDPQHSSWAQDETILAPPFANIVDLNTGANYISILGSFMAISRNGSTDIPNKVTGIDLSTLQVLWTFEIPGSMAMVGFAPAISDSLVLCSGQKVNALYALGRKTGIVRWTRPCSGQLFGRMATIDAKKVFFLRDSLICLNLLDGSTVWRQKLNGSQTIPAVDDSNVYVTSYPGFAKKLYAFDKRTGAPKWQVDNDGYECLSVDKKYVYTRNGETIVARSKSTGAIVLTFAFPTGLIMPYNFTGSIAVSDRAVCFGLQDQVNNKVYLYCLKKIDLTEAWRHEFASNWVFPPTIANNIVYVLDNSREIFGFSLPTGEQIFNHTPLSCNERLVVANHTLYAASNDKVRMFSNQGSLVAESAAQPQDFELEQNYPNPFNAATTISYHLPNRSHVAIVVYSLLGQPVATLQDSIQEPGLHSITWNAGGLPSGVYYYRITAGEYSRVKKAVVIN